MTYHILNGDALASGFHEANIQGELIVMRECLIEGDLHGDSLNDFWHTRADYLSNTDADRNYYYIKVAKEIEKILAAPGASEFNLWFGYDLFCRANMWFLMSLLCDLKITKHVYVVYPSFLQNDEIWKEFGKATLDNLLTSFNNRILFYESDLIFGKDLWSAYKNNDLEKLKKLSEKESNCFPYLREVCKAHIDRFSSDGKKGRPELVIEEIIQNGSADFETVFRKFYEREGIYGFGDEQLKAIYDKVVDSL